MGQNSNFHPIHLKYEEELHIWSFNSTTIFEVKFVLWILQVSCSARRLILSVRLSVCLLPAGHNFRPIFTKLHHTVEFVIRKKLILFEVKRST